MTTRHFELKGLTNSDILAFLQAVTGGSIAENPFRSVIERHVGFLRRALPVTSGRAQKSREVGGGGKRKTAGFSPLSPPPSPRSLCQLSTRPRPGRANSRWRPHYEFRFFSDHPTACVQASDIPGGALKQYLPHHNKFPQGL